MSFLDAIAQYERVLDTLYTAHDYLVSLIKESISSLDELMEKESISAGDNDIVVKVNKLKDEFISYMNNDFSTPKALSTLLRFAKYIISLASEHEDISRDTLIILYTEYTKMARVFGVLNERKPPYDLEKLVNELLSLILEIRNYFRRQKAWDIADNIRERLNELGILINDTKYRTLWRWSRS